MFNNNLPVSSLFCKISLLCLPHCLPACIYYTFLFFCLLCFLHHSHSMHLLSFFHFSCCPPPPSSHMHHSQQQQPQSLLFSTFLYSLCILCILYMQWFFIHCMLSALPLHHRNSSASLFVKAICPSSLGVMIKFLHITGNWDSSSSVAVDLNLSVVV